ncbi:MAG: hypothetical protein K6G30_01245 [Acetatifactor sp.]|nr:hypothetical protein [Acetatifactor sp.]
MNTMEQMKKIVREMNILMGIALSFCLSLTGLLSAGVFTVIGFLISFLVSLIVSLLIGFLVPLKKITDLLCGKLGLAPRKIGTRCFEAFISDLIYTPFITVIMVSLNYMQATVHGAQIPYLPMLGKALLVSMPVGFVLIFLLMPIFLKIVFKRNGVQPFDKAE